VLHGALQWRYHGYVTLVTVDGADVMENEQWLLFVPQVSASSSRLRVQIWRHLRAAGAISLQNGVWVLPRTETHSQFLRQEMDDIVRQGGTALLFVATPMGVDLQERFRVERGREYAEVIERCQALLDELARETEHGKLTFAELEENEQDLQRLVTWLAKIRARDFFDGYQADEAAAMLARCEDALHTFAQGVYAKEGVLDDGLVETRPSGEESR
jgi:ChrB-like protein